jgi:hypothetical protein
VSGNCESVADILVRVIITASGKAGSMSPRLFGVEYGREPCWRLEFAPGLATEFGQLVEIRRRAVQRVERARSADRGTEVRSAPLSGPAGRKSSL